MFTQRFLCFFRELVDSVAQMGDGTGFTQPHGKKYYPKSRVFRDESVLKQAAHRNMGRPTDLCAFVGEGQMYSEAYIHT